MTLKTTPKRTEKAGRAPALVIRTPGSDGRESVPAEADFHGRRIAWSSEE
jgi:hypothetical protein